MAEPVITPPGRRSWVVAFVLIAALFVALGTWYFRAELERIRDDKLRELEGIAELQASRLLEWWRETLADAQRIAADPLVVEAERLLRQDPARASVRADLRRRVELELLERFDDVLVVDAEGRIVVSARDDSAPVNDIVLRGIAAAFISRVATMAGPYRDAHGHVVVDVVMPLAPEALTPQAAIVLRSDASITIYPLIAGWPTPSATAETMLVVREGDEVVFLNPVRHRADAALALRLPVARRELPSVQAALGVRRSFEGRDYRGVPVLADLRAVPELPWHLVTKVDASEVFEPARTRALTTGAFVLLGILLAAAATAYAYRWRQVGLLSRLYETERRAQDALRQSEERLRLALQAANQGLYDLDVQTGGARVSPEYATMLGYDPDTFVETHAMWRERLHPDDRAAVSQAYDDYIAGRTSEYLVEFRQRAQDGRWTWILSLGRVVERDAEGRPRRMLGTHTDITPRKEAELRLAQYAAQLDAAELHAGLGSWSFDVSTGEPWWSRHLLRLFGLDPARGAPSLDELLEHLHPDDRAKAAEVFERMARGELPAEHVFRTNPALGPVRWFRPTVYCERDGEGRPLKFVGTALDITDRVLAEEALQTSERMLRLFIEHAPAAIAMFDRDMRYLAASRRYLVDYGLGTADIVGRLHYDVLPEIPERWREIHRRCLAGATERSDEEAFQRADGRVDWVRWEIRPWYEQDGCVGGLVLFSEVVTERRRADEERQALEAQLRQAQRMEAVGRLAGGVAHDFNNMLQTILGYADLLLDELEPSSPLRGDLEEIRRAAARSADLTRQLLAFARKQTIAPEVLDLNETMAALLNMLRRMIGEDIDLQWKPAPDLWSLSVDPSQVNQVLANLVVNARDAIAGVGRIAIETGMAELDERYCQAHPGFEPGQYVTVVVRDDGCGMDEETKARIFEPFFTTKPAGQGTGLGLATVYGIATQNHGFVTVDSEPGRGSTFTVFLPRHDPTPAHTEAGALAEAPAVGSETVLLVEDETALLRLATKMLEQLGYDVLPASSVGRALELVSEHPGDIPLLITDVVMPEASGRELWQRLAALRPSLRCLFMSGYTADVIAQEGVLEEGMHFLQKPFTREALAAKVREALGVAAPGAAAPGV